MLLKMSMVLPGFAVLAMAIAVLVSGDVNLNEPIWSDACKAPVCEVAEKQAEGLARLRVLSNYVKETMTLMESVVSSLDNEMMEVGQELSNVVGRRCHSRGPSALTFLMTRMNDARKHEVENRIIEVTSDSDDTWASSDMTQGSTSTLSGDADGASHGISQRPSSASHSTTLSTSQEPSSAFYSTSHSTSQRPGSTSQSSSSSSILQTSSAASHSTGKIFSRRPSNSQKYEAQPSASTASLSVTPEPPLEVGGGGSRAQGGGREQGGSRGQGRGTGRGRGRGQGRGRGHGHGRSGLQASSSCRGVPIGSPHYVPNLDNWCATNCPLGSCPTTHCIC